MIETTIHELLHSLCFTDSIVHPATRVIGKHYLGISLSTHRYSYPKLTLNFEIILQQYHARGGRIKSDLALVNIALALKDLDKFKEFLEQDLR